MARQILTRTVQSKGLRRLAYYVRRVVASGAPTLWKGYSLVSALGVVSVATAGGWVLATDPAIGVGLGLLTFGVIYLIGSYRLWDAAETRGDSTVASALRERIALGYHLRDDLFANPDAEYERSFDTTPSDAFSDWWYGTSDLVRRECPEHWDRLIDRQAPANAGTHRKQLVALLNAKVQVLSEIITTGRDLDRQVRVLNASGERQDTTLDVDVVPKPATRERDLFDAPAYLPQLRITNTGLNAARDVRVEIVAWMKGVFPESRPVARWERRPLHWPDGEPSDTPRDLRPQDSIPVDLACAQQSGGEPDQLMLFVSANPQGLLGNSHRRFEPGGYRVRVRATARNARPADEEFELDFVAWDQLSVRRDVITAYDEEGARNHAVRAMLERQYVLGQHYLRDIGRIETSEEVDRWDERVSGWAENIRKRLRMNDLPELQRHFMDDFDVPERYERRPGGVGIDWAREETRNDLSRRLLRLREVMERLNAPQPP